MLRLSHYPNANADVESSHRLIEDEFYSRESFSSIKDFLNKASEKIKIFSSIAFMPPPILDELLGKNSTIPSLNPIYSILWSVSHVPEPPE